MDNTKQQVPPIQNIEQPQSTPPPNPSSSLRTFIIVLCAVLLTIIGAVGYKLGTRKNQTVNQQPISTSPTSSQLSPTHDETANWYTYTNTKYGFSVKYPIELSDYVLQIESRFRISFPGTFDGDLFAIDSYEATSSTTDWWNQVGKVKYPWIFNTAFNQIEISGPNGELKGIRGTEVLGQRKSPGGSTLSTSLYLVSHNNYIFVLSDNSGEDNKYDKIIKTFKFID